MSANLPDINTLIQAGIDPKTKLPIKMGPIKEGFKANNKKLLRILDEQDAINSFTWYNLPNGLNGRLIERILYYRGQGMIFYMEANDQWYFLPYALDGSIDVYGRFMGVTPLPFGGTASTESDGTPKAWVTGLIKKPVYDIQLTQMTYNEIIDSCVLLKDYTEQYSQTNIARQILNDPLLDVMADCIPFMRTALLSGTGIKGVRVTTEDEQANVKIASMAMDRAALVGEKYIPIVGGVDFQDLTDGAISKAEEYLLAMQSLDNYRLSLHGLDNGGLFLKQSHILEAEQAVNSGKASLVLQDRLQNRQDFCDIFNSITGLGIWCDISESAINVDRDLDGEVSENDPESPSYEGGVDNDEYVDG